MSHVTTTRSPIPITDRAALISAAKKLGAEVLFNAEARGWGGQMHHGEIVLRHKDSPYDVALNRNSQGHYEFNADLFGGHVARVYGVLGDETELGGSYGRLVALYGAEVGRKIALLRGYQVKQAVDHQSGVITQRVVIGR